MIERSINSSVTSPAPSHHARRPGRPCAETNGSADVAERLIDAATELAAEQSFEACGLREIAARASVSVGMISYYFGDRQGLYEAMFKRAIDRVSAGVTALLAQDQQDGCGAGGAGNAAVSGTRPKNDRLDALLAAHVAAIAADPWLPKLIMRELMSNREASLQHVLIDRMGSGAMPMMIEWIESQQAAGLLRKDLDARLLTVSLTSLTVFPFLMLPIVGENLGIAVDDSFPALLIEHNQRLLGRGLGCRAEDD